MHEILFKAKRIDNGEWVEGHLVTRKYAFNNEVFEAHIITDAYEQYGVMNFGTTPVLISPVDNDCCFRVDHNTICQYTGLTDKNGNKNWENDICSTDLERPFLIVEFRNGGFMYNCNDGKKDYYDIMLPTEPLEQQDKYTEVIGNIFDNKDLLQ